MHCVSHLHPKLFAVSFTVPTGHWLVHFLYVKIVKSWIYPCVHKTQFIAVVMHPEQLLSQGKHLFWLISAYVPDWQFVLLTQVIVVGFKKVVPVQDVHLNPLSIHEKQFEEQIIHILAESL